MWQCAGSVSDSWLQSRAGTDWDLGQDKFPVRLFVLYKGGLAQLWPQVLAWLGSKVWIIGQSDGQECISYFTTAGWIFISFVPPWLGLAGAHSFITQNWESVQFIWYKSNQSRHRALPSTVYPTPSLSVCDTQFSFMLTPDQFVTNYRIKRHLFWVGLLGSLSLILCHQTSWMLFILAVVNWMTRTGFVTYILVKIPRLAR